MSTKTNAMRALENLGVPYEVRTYEVDPENLAAEMVAKKLGLPEEQIFKTLCVRGDRTGIMFAVIAAGTRLDLKALARASGDRRVEPVALKEVQPLTGYIRGAVTALAAKKAYPVFLDDTAEVLELIGVSGGARGVELILAPMDYVRAVGAKLAPIGVPTASAQAASLGGVTVEE